MAYSNSWVNSTPANPCAVTIAPNAGDIIIAWSITDQSGAADADTDPAGYTRISRQTTTTDSAAMLVVYKIATGSETSISFSSSSSNTQIAGAMTFSGRDGTTPLDVTPGTFNSSTTGTTSDISITPVTDGCDLCFVYGNDTGSVNPTFTFSTTSGTTGSWTTQVDQNSGFYNIAAGYATQTTAGALTARGTASDTGGRLSVLIALRPTPPAGQDAYPTSDITAGSWTPSTGSDLYATIDETSASDADYDSVNSNSTMRVGLGTLSTPAAGTQTLSYRIKGSAEKKAIARLIEGSTTVQTFTDDPIPETLTTKDQTVTNSISNYGNLRFEIEIADATSAPSPSVSFGTIGTGVNGTTSIATGYPASIAAGDLLVIVATTGATTSETPGTPSGWTSQGSYATTDGTFGVDTGPRRVTVFTKEAVGTETGTVAVATTNGNTGRCTMLRFAKTHPSYTWDIAATGGFYGPGTAVSVTGGSLSFAPGDVVMVSGGQRVDSVTQSAQSLTASGITFGTRTNRAAVAVTTGNDIRHSIDTFAAVTSGTATVAPTWSYTASASASAAIHFLRLREVPPTEKARITWVKFNVPDAGGGGGDASISLSGISGTSAIGALSLTGTADKTLSGIAGTGAVGTISTAVLLQLLGNAAAGAAGTLTESGTANKTLTGTAGTGAVGTLTLAGAAALSLSGNAATGNTGTLSLSGASALTLSGVSVATAAGIVSIAGAASVTLPGVFITGQIGAITASAGGNANVSLSGNAATGNVGALTLAGAAAQSLLGVSANSAIGAISLAVAKTLSGVSATGNTGTVTLSASALLSLLGVSSAASAGIISVAAGASVTLTGVNASGQIGTVTASAGSSATITLSGAASIAAVGTLALRGDAIVLLPGTQASGLAGNIRLIEIITPGGRLLLVQSESRFLIVQSDPRILLIDPDDSGLTIH